ncbi:MAG TPA: ATP-dependent protease ATPase subunit HslU [Firmicutes bacterium]|jgi:ATP-dependent HslUV protease ATP-binding subunit HslU|nr:ATP-dependent protease ATPase subunit HslU [Bacillota bacterium]
MLFSEEELTPRKVVEELDKYIIGQQDAKKSVAIALRNRYRRRLLQEKIKEEIIPKNIIMIGPTGVGKTEIARRLARMVNSPFIKVEATKFTEVGYVGRDVDSMIRDLVESAVRIVKKEKTSAVEKRAIELAEERLLDLLLPALKKNKVLANPFDLLFQTAQGSRSDHLENNVESTDDLSGSQRETERNMMRKKLKNGELENVIVEVEIEDRSPSSFPMMDIFSGLGADEIGVNIQDIFGNILPRKKKKKKLTVKQSRKVLVQEESEKLINMDDVISEAIEKAEQSGIVFLDEIDKIAGSENKAGGPDVSREGVQRDILPIVEGSTVMTKYGPVRTDYMLFIAAGAFHFSKPSDLIPELQGRFPIRVELQSLTKEDFRKILTETENALIKQYTALLATEGVKIAFDEEGIEEICSISSILNEEMENIGARRLHTVLEKILEEVSFFAPELKGQKIVINREYVKNKLKEIVKNKDLSRYIL